MWTSFSLALVARWDDERPFRARDRGRAQGAELERLKFILSRSMLELVERMRRASSETGVRQVLDALSRRIVGATHIAGAKAR